MAKRGYKLQEFVAHSSNVNCLKIGKKACRLFITGGDDHKMHLWAIGKPTSLMSLYGHTSPVESLAFDSAEVLVAAGASSGMVKLWDLEEAKMVRTLTGHKSNCTAVEFHPFGEFFASGSIDTNLKIWDIRKKGCIHTYKGHTQGISTIKFTPDGRWVVSGGFDNVVKIWDLTAGKLLHEFKFHEGHIRSIDFHPLEFLLATGSADKTVKFWDLETFELIGSSRPEATGVRSITFHPDGRTLFCGLEDSFKVYSWEPVIRHDAIDMGWSTLGDLCIRDGKLLGCSYYMNSIAVWVSDISLVEPYGNGLPTEHKSRVDQKFSLENQFTQNVASNLRSTSDIHSVSLDDEMKEIKNIYIDPGNGKPVISLQDESASLPKIEVRSDSKEFIDVQAKKQSPSLMSTVPGRPGHTRKPSKGRIDSGSNDVKKVVESTRVVEDTGKDCSEDKLPNIGTGPTEHSSLSTPSGDSSIDCSKGATSVKLVKGVAVISGRTWSLVERFERKERFSSQEDSVVSFPDVISEDTPVTPGPRSASSTKENSQGSAVKLPESQISRTESVQPQVSENVGVEPQISFVEVGETQKGGREPLQSQLIGRKSVQPQISETEIMPPQVSEKEEKDPQISGREEIVQCQKTSRESFQSQLLGREPLQHQISEDVAPPQVSEKEVRQPQISGREGVQRQKSGRESFQSQFSRRESLQPQISRRELVQPHLSGKDVRRSQTSERDVVQRQRSSRDSFPSQLTVRESVQRQRSGREVMQPQRAEKDIRQSGRELVQRQKSGRESVQPRLSRLEFPQPQILGRDFTPLTIKRESVQPQLSGRDLEQVHISEMGFTKSQPDIFESESAFAQPQISDREFAEIQLQVSESESASPNDEEITEILMQTHDVFLSTLRSRLTKLQVVHHFWARNDIKGAIDALRKLPDHSVQADVVSVLTEKLDMLDLDLFSFLLPVLMGLLDSKTERHTQVSLELLLKLVAVFGQVIQSTISARPTVGVDLHAEYRLECCKQCFIQLQKIQKILPLLIRRGGSLARSAQELNLVLEL